jgi:RNA polymerase sigma-70 factor (ECF subfamily)
VGATLEHRLGFEHFYRDEREPLLRALLFTLDDRELALEATDEALARAYERWDEVAAKDNPAGWVYRVALNFARNRVRRRVLERDRPLLGATSAPAAEDLTDPALAAALARLPLDQRTVVVLRFHLDWSVEDVAAALGIARGTVKSRLHRALRRLETMLQEQG